MWWQAWRLIQNPTSLCSQIFKGLYFPHTDTLHAEKGSRPSWGWQSLLLGRNAISPSLQWVVRNGEKISIKNDQWLPRGLIGGPANRDDPSRVSELITRDSATRKEDRVLELFDHDM